MTLKQFKTKICMMLLPDAEILKLDAIYFYYHELDESYSETTYTTATNRLKNMIEKIW